MLNKIILFLLLISLSLGGYSQGPLSPFSISLSSEAIGLPFTNYSPIHPGVELSKTLRRNEQTNNIQYVNVKAGFFHHERLMNAFYLGGEYQYSHKVLDQKLSVDLPLGLGYMHTFYPGDLYVQNDAGDFETISQTGRAHAYVNVGVGLTYIGSDRVQPFIRQELMLQTPFANGIPAIPHSLLKVGVQINLSSNENR